MTQQTLKAEKGKLLNSLDYKIAEKERRIKKLKQKEKELEGKYSQIKTLFA